MNSANYTALDRYALTTQGLDFIQNQILALQNLVYAVGDKVILTGCTDGLGGWAVLDGELIECDASVSTALYVKVSETQNTSPQRTYRQLVACAASDSGSIPKSEFTNTRNTAQNGAELDNIRTLANSNASKIATLQTKTSTMPTHLYCHTLTVMLTNAAFETPIAVSVISTSTADLTISDLVGKTLQVSGEGGRGSSGDYIHIGNTVVIASATSATMSYYGSTMGYTKVEIQSQSYYTIY